MIKELLEYLSSEIYKIKMNYIYITTNLKNGKQYIGSHKGTQDDNYLGSGKLLLYSVKKYGKEKFKREILEECKVEDNLILETKYIKEYNTLTPNGYNILENGGHIIWTNELRKKISDKQKGKTLSTDHKKNIGNSLKGKKRDPKIGKKIRETRIKNDSYKVKDSTKEKIRIANLGEKNPNWGKIRSKETKEKIRQSNLGKKRSEEVKKNMSIGQIGKKLSKEHIKQLQKNGKKNKGIKHSEKSKDNMSKAHIGIKQKRIVCKYCKKDIAVNIYTRFHGEKCKNKLI